MSDLIPPNKTWTAQGYIASIKEGELHTGPIDPNSMETTSVFEDYSNHLFNQVQDANTRIAELERALEDAINSPKGVVPKSADKFWSGRAGRVKRV